MSKDNSYNEEEDDDLNNYYESEEVDDEMKQIIDKKANVQFYKDQPYDLAYDINESVEGEDLDKNGINQHVNTKEEKTNFNQDREEEEDEEENNYENRQLYMNDAGSQSNLKKLPKYDFSELYNLNTTPEIKELLNILTRFVPQEIELDAKLKPYIPSYIPSVGEVDAFIKVGRPDNREEDLGLTVLDEPIINGVDPYIFKLELIDKSKVRVDRYEVKSVPEAEKNPKSIQNWIDKIAELRKNKISSSVSYSKKMPDVETLMQVWPDKIESVLKDISFPDEKLNMSIENYSKIICNMSDIPIHQLTTNRSVIEALHVLFTLYSEFKENQHFQRSDGTNKEENSNVQTMKFY